MGKKTEKRLKEFQKDLEKQQELLGRLSEKSRNQKSDPTLKEVLTTALITILSGIITALVEHFLFK